MAWNPKGKQPSQIVGQDSNQNPVYGSVGRNVDMDPPSAAKFNGASQGGKIANKGTFAASPTTATAQGTMTVDPSAMSPQSRANFYEKKKKQQEGWGLPATVTSAQAGAALANR